MFCGNKMVQCQEGSNNITCHQIATLHNPTLKQKCCFIYTFTKETRTQYQLQETNVAYSFLVVVDGEKDDEEHVGWFFEFLKNYQS
jgi:hypothetical protein